MTGEVARLEQTIGELRAQLADARRRRDPVSSSYTFKSTEGRTVALPDLFGDRSDLIVVHNMGRSCAYCTMWADGLNGVIRHLEDRAAFALCTPDDPATAGEFARQRGWSFQVICLDGSPFARDLGFEPEAGKHWPGVSAFRRLEDGSIVRTGTASFGPGDDFCAVWHLFDLLQDGADGWKPKLEYTRRPAASHGP